MQAKIDVHWMQTKQQISISIFPRFNAMISLSFSLLSTTMFLSKAFTDSNKFQMDALNYRPSGTEDVVRVFAEAESQELCDQLANQVAELVKAYAIAP